MPRLAVALVALTLITVASVARAELPTYTGYQLQARGNAAGAGFNLPNESQVVNQRPAINDSRQIAFTYTDINLDKAVWLGQNGAGTTITQSFSIASDATINNDGVVVWRVSLEGANDGVWRAIEGLPALLTTGPAGTSDWDSPRIANDGRIGYRANVLGTPQYVIRETDGSFTTVAIQNSAPFSFLASPAFNNNGSFSARVFDASMSGQQQIRRFDDDGVAVLIAIPEGGVTGFLNNTDVNDLGQVGYEAFMPGSVEVIVFADENNKTTIAQSGGGGTFSDIATFGPAVNNAGVVAFRGTQGGVEGVYIGDGVTTQRVVGVGDTLDSDLGPAVITGFSSGVDINENGDVAFNAAMNLIASGQSIGRGIVVALAETDACVAGDLDDSGTVDLADVDDFVDVLLGAAAAEPCRADVNADTSIDGLDIGGFIALLLG